jgi:hypothetical protein
MEVKTWLEEAKKTKLQVGKSINNWQELGRCRRNRKRKLNFLQDIEKAKDSINRTHAFSLPVCLQMLEIAKITLGKVNILKTFVYFEFPTFLTNLTSPPASK